MVKTNTPLLSLSSSGTLAGVLTTQRRGSATLVRSKPTPTYRYTLPQAYQRWLYEDYAYLWRQQTGATRNEYRSAGVRFHLTAFQYWMKYQLTNLPDIMGLWHLDRGTLITAIDFSKQGNHGTVIGASPIDGVIQRALYGDGINDCVTIPIASSLEFGTGDFTYECFARIEGWLAAGTDSFLSSIAFPYACQLDFHNITNRLRFIPYVGGAAQIMQRLWNAVLDTWYHLVWRRASGTCTMFVDGAQLGASQVIAGSIDLATSNWSLFRHGGRYLKGRIDHFVIYNRALDETEILRHSERRYPLQ